jgi:hypothetical protein
LVGIEYEDADGNFSRRRVTVRAVKAGLSTSYLYGICHEREAFRCFRVDRIKALIDVRTGEVFAPSVLPSFLHGHELDPSEAENLPGDQDEAYKRCRGGLLALMLVAWADGDVGPAEKVVLHNFVQETCRGLADYDPERLLRWALRQYPSADQVVRTLQRLVETDWTGNEFDRLLQYAIRLAEADRVVSPAEVGAISNMRVAGRLAIEDLGHATLEDFVDGWAFKIPLPACSDAIDLRFDERRKGKVSKFVWTRGQPPVHAFRFGDVFTCRHEQITLQVAAVTQSRELGEEQQVTIAVYGAHAGAALAYLGRAELAARELEEVLRHGGGKLRKLTPYIPSGLNERQFSD